MSDFLGERVFRRQLTRRDFLWLVSATTTGVAGGCLSGCATDPVTGEKILVGLSEGQEIQLDRENSPHQFSADYGPVQDSMLNDYVAGVGKDLAALSHRPRMPYSFRAVNANNINAYAFPGGSIAATRGILVELDNEAELAGLLGHEVGHVTARHAAEQAGKTMVAQATVLGAAAYAGSKQAGLGNVVASVGSLGAGALLAHYNRDNERESDDLGMQYMTRAGYNPDGMVGLMDVLRSQHQTKPGAMELMFATHPQSEERYQTALRTTQARYRGQRNLPLHRERYMDHTAALRRLKGTIAELQKGERLMARQDYGGAEDHYVKALQQTPDDYPANILMGKCQLAQEQPREAQRYFERAQAVYPQEAQAHNLNGIAKLNLKDYAGAYRAFDRYERLLPGNPNTIFLKGIALESMQDRRRAAQEYYRYLNTVDQGPAARHAYERLVNWGYVQKK